MCLQRIPGLINPLNTGDKILNVFKFGIIRDNYLTSPFQFTEIKNEMEVPEMTFRDGLVECGLHSYLTEVSAELAIKRYKTMYCEPAVLLNCIIPTNTDYYVGIRGDVVSQKLRLNYLIYYTEAFDKKFQVVLKDGSYNLFTADSKDHLMLILNYLKISYKNIVEV